MTPTVGEVYRVAGQPRTAAFRVLSVDGGEVCCWGGHGGFMAYRSFRASQLGAVVPRSGWPTLLLPADERPEIERKRSERRTARRMASR